MSTTGGHGSLQYLWHSMSACLMMALVERPMELPNDGRLARMRPAAVDAGGISGGVNTDTQLVALLLPAVITIMATIR